MARPGVNTAANDDGDDGLESREQVQRVSWPLLLPARFQVPQGTRVYVQGNFEADFSTGRDEDYNRGRNTRHELQPMGQQQRYGCMIPNLQVGRFYRFTFVFVHPDGRQEVIRNHGESFNTKVSQRDPRQPDAQNPAETLSPMRQPSGPTPEQQQRQAQVTGIRKTIDSGVKHVLEGAQTAETFEGFMFRVRRLQRDLEHEHHQRLDVTPIMVNALVQAIRADAKYPKELKPLLTDQIGNFDQLETALEEGARAYRESVFFKILFDDAARKFFKLEASDDYSDSDPLGNSRWNNEFRQACDARCLGGMGGVFKESLGVVARNPSVKPSITPRLHGLMRDVLSHMPAKERQSVLDTVPENRRDKMADFLVKAGPAASMLLGGGLGLAAVSALEGVFSGVTGLRTVDLLKLRRTEGWKEVGRKLLQNNIVVDAVTAKRDAGKALGNRLLETLGRSIPLWNLKYAGKGVTSHGMYEERAGTPPAGEGAAGFITKACDAAAGQGGSAPSASLPHAA